VVGRIITLLLYISSFVIILLHIITTDGVFYYELLLEITKVSDVPLMDWYAFLFVGYCMHITIVGLLEVMWALWLMVIERHLVESPWPCHKPTMTGVIPAIKW